MTDRESRSRLALALRQLASGLMTNDEFDDSAVATYINLTDDPALAELSTFGWLHYSDIYRYRLKGRHSLSNEQRTGIARAVLFLKTDQEYVHGDFLRSGTFLGTPAQLGCVITVILAAGIGVYSHFALESFWLGFFFVVGIVFLLIILASGLIQRLQRRPREHQCASPNNSCSQFIDARAAGGEFRFWPFATEQEYELALVNPPFLCGQVSTTN